MIRALATLLVTAGCSRAPSLPAGDPLRPDIIVVSIDTLRADHLGAYGHHRATTPFLDAQAASGLWFSSAWSPSPWTLPSHATLLSGVLPPAHGAVEGDRTIRADVSWLPEALRAGGYSTVGVVASWFVSRRYGFARGFDSFFDFEFEDEKQNLSKSPRAEVVLQEVVERGGTLPAGRPAFVFVHLYDVHYPYAPPEPWDAKFDPPSRDGESKYRNYEWYLDHPLDPTELEHQVSQYDEELAYVDDQLRQFHARWTAARPAVFVIVSDHGEEFGERGSWGHGHTVWPEQLHVPWIVFGPGVSPQVIDRRVGLEDVAPTVAGLAGIPWASGAGTDRRAAADQPPGGRYAETSRFRSASLRWHDAGDDWIIDLRRGMRYRCELSTDPECRRPEANSNSFPVAEAALGAWMGSYAPVVQREITVSSSGWGFDGSAFRSLRAPRTVAAGSSLLVFPWDEPLTVVDRGTPTPRALIDGSSGPEDALQFWLGSRGATAIPLSEDQKQALEALGYVQ